jgi:hypothetical protein
VGRGARPALSPGRARHRRHVTRITSGDVRDCAQTRDCVSSIRQTRALAGDATGPTCVASPSGARSGEDRGV